MMDHHNIQQKFNNKRVDIHVYSHRFISELFLTCTSKSKDQADTQAVIEVPSINDSDTSSFHWVYVPHPDVAIQASAHHQTTINTQAVNILREERKK